MTHNGILVMYANTCYLAIITVQLSLMELMKVFGCKPKDWANYNFDHEWHWRKSEDYQSSSFGI